MKTLPSVTIALTLFCLAPSVLAQKIRDPDWKPNPALLRTLIPASGASEFQLLCPRDYQFQSLPGPAGSMGKAWVSPLRADRTRVYIMVTTLTPPKEESTKYAADQVLDKMLSAIERQRKDWKRSVAQRGTINGLTFYRAYWKGTNTTTGQAMRGFSYVAQTATGYVQLSSQDFEPAAQTSLALTEAMALTFKIVP
jgi:hypothetical protein